MKIRSHDESHIVEMDDGSRWRIFPGDLDITLGWKPETDLKLNHIQDDVSSLVLVSIEDDSRVRVIPAGENWPARETKNVLREG